MTRRTILQQKTSHVVEPTLPFTKKKKKAVLAATFLLVLILTFSPSQAPPPTPHNVKGFVFDQGGSGMPNGIPVLINNTVTGSSTLTSVDAPPVPSLAGAYSGTIDGNDGDAITVFSWNDTHYGKTAGTLFSTTEINVTVNMTRAPEPNVTIIIPSDNTTWNITEAFNITANITVLFADGTCNATITFGNESILNITPGENTTNDLGFITQGTTVNTTFSVTGTNTGSSSVTVSASCSPTGPIFSATTADSLTNLTIFDNQPPVIQLVSPPNNTENKTSSTITFTYNVTDHSPIQWCSLIIDGSINKTNTTITKDTNQYFTTTLTNGQHNWSVNCTDQEGNEGASEIRNITVSYNHPSIRIVAITQNIILNAGSTKQVECNATITDEDGPGDIATVNATLYHTQNTSSDPDHPRYHYTNASCQQYGTSANSANYTCAFFIQYYALNGTWECNASVKDLQGLANSTTNQTTVDPLLAINVTPVLIDYGNVPAGGTSQEQTVNITNVGNVPINVSVYGYGATPGDGLAMVCSTGNITISDERYASTPGVAYAAKTLLTAILQDAGITLPPQTTQATSEDSLYFQLGITPTDPPLSLGTCNGTVVFQANTP
ncbi:hypothetical protein D6783_01810 [Candidatus Woesearchaeota archaeon]|nr:MAG: hypothetical protein D6783_01810 [Candidatus Woesearchaeota archaeon]